MRFFINHPRFSMVISVVMSLAGLIAAINLPIEQYPNVTPPQIQVSASYPGANAEVVANTVAAPLEDAINGVEGMIYMSSTSSNTGNYSLTITFETGTDSDMALVKVQNKVQQAMPMLPKEVTDRGITTDTSFSNTLAFLALKSPNGTHDRLTLTDYALNNVTNVLKRVPGMGDVSVYGAKYSVRIWLNPERLASLGLSTTDVANAILNQNKQASIGSIGTTPNEGDGSLIYSLTAIGRLQNVKQFEEVILRTNEQGGMVKLKDVSRIELGAESYNMQAGIDGAPAAMISLSQSAKSNALELMRGATRVLDDIKTSLPPDMEFVISHDSTKYVNATIYEILTTLILTFVLVIIVCYVFLQDWRVTLVPVAAIPISLLATFSGLSVLGFSINMLTLFGLVLVIGTVVDNAIIVVERVLFVMHRDNSNSTEATLTAMKEVSGPMTATTLVFLAIFVPVAFMGGITGEIYRQFAVTISFSVCFSLIVALTLSPAMCAYMLNNVKPKTRGPLAWFNKALDASTRGYVSGAMVIARSKILTILLFVLISAGCYLIVVNTPTSFIPDEDQGVIFMAVQLPEGASMNRTIEVMGGLIPKVKQIPGVNSVMSIEGSSILGDSGENVGSLIIPLDDWGNRKDPHKSIESITGQLRAIASEVKEARINIFTPPAIMGLGMSGGLDLRLQSTTDNDPQQLARVMNEFLGKMNTVPEIAYAFSSYTADTPHLNLDLDREKVEMFGISVKTVFDTLQTYFGTAYINDINIGTQVNKVILQSDWEFRKKIDNVESIYVRSATGDNVPMRSFASINKILAPRSINRYNLFPSAGITGFMNPQFSTGQGIARVAELAKTLPEGYKYEWSGMTYQEQSSGGQVAVIIAIALLFGYLFLVAQYESWSIPLGVILSLPVALFGVLIGVFVMNISLSIYTQLGILLLVGLAAKNAILIIEFAKEQHDENGLPILEAASVAAGERFRSVMMTAITCVFGVIPMLFASGAGAGSRLHVGTTMFFGMSVATAFGIFIIPGLYVFLQTYREKLKAMIGMSK